MGNYNLTKFVSSFYISRNIQFSRQYKITECKEIMNDITNENYFLYSLKGIEGRVKTIARVMDEYTIQCIDKCGENRTFIFKDGELIKWIFFEEARISFKPYRRKIYAGTSTPFGGILIKDNSNYLLNMREKIVFKSSPEFNYLDLYNVCKLLDISFPAEYREPFEKEFKALFSSVITERINSYLLAEKNLANMICDYAFPGK